jgi:hypothetical protein
MVGAGKEQLKQDYKTSLAQRHETEGAQTVAVLRKFRNMKFSIVI